jgi:uncharacterized protein (UPF0332 family)
MTQDSSREFARASLAKAAEMLDDAVFLLSQERYNSAVDRAYYAMFHSSRAALAGAVITPPRSHRSLNSLLSEALVRQAKLEGEYTRQLVDSFRARQRSTYDVETRFGAQQASQAIVQAEGFLDGIRRLVAEEAR